MDPRVIKFREAQDQAQAEREASFGTRYNELVEAVNDINYYGDGNSRHTLDVYSPKDAGDEVLPVILEIHGGGYIANTKAVTRIHAKYFASRGFRVVNGDYTLLPEGSFGMELQEIADIFRWIWENRETYHFDINRVFLTGDSAGGHLTLLYAMLQGSEKMRRYFNVTMPPVTIKAAAPTCPAFWFRIDPDYPENAGMNFFVDLLFPNGAEKELRDMLDVVLLSKESEFPPLHIIAAPQDDLLFRYDLILKEELEKTGREVEFDICEKITHDLPHVFNVILTDWEESIEANERIIRFLNKH